MEDLKEKKSTKAIAASNVFSTLAGTAAACCTGPGLAACSATCAPSCGSLAFSAFGLSSSAFTSWLSQYWYLFLILSVVSFAYAFYKLFIKANCNTSRFSKSIFFSCFAFSCLIILWSSLTC